MFGLGCPGFSKVNVLAAYFCIASELKPVDFLTFFLLNYLLILGILPDFVAYYYSGYIKNTFIHHI